MTDGKPLAAELDAQRQKVDVDHFDFTVRELVRMAEEGELLRAPRYQRKFRWKETAESRLIESIFLGLPVPSLFVAANKNGTWEVVDGLQRLSTLLHFMGSEVAVKSVGKKKPLELDGLEKLTSFNAKTYKSLPMTVQLKFSKKMLRVTALSDKSATDVRFEMFERLNTGGVALTPQEVRACIFRGPFADFLRKMSETEKFVSLCKFPKDKQNDGTREEVVLKFFAYYTRRDDFDGNVTKFLNDYMADASEEFDYEWGRETFLGAADLASRSMAGKPLLRSGYHSTPINQLEAVLVACGDLIEEDPDISPTPKKQWLNDKELIRFSTKGTNTPNMLDGRVERAKELIRGATVRTK